MHKKVATKVTREGTAGEEAQIPLIQTIFAGITSSSMTVITVNA